MVKRRKVLIGVGSLAAGSAAAMSTGALSAQSADRQLDGRVAADAAGYTRIRPEDLNGHFAETKDNGEIYLNFDQNGSGGNGLNPDSLNMFYNVFYIENWSLEGPKAYYIERDGPNMDRVEFFNAGTGEGIDPPDYYSITGSRGGTGGDSVLHSKATGDDSEYGKGRLRVDVQIDLRDSELSAGDSLTDLFGEEDNFVIVAEQP
jgi:hypothetical protein